MSKKELKNRNLATGADGNEDDDDDDDDDDDYAPELKKDSGDEEEDESEGDDDEVNELDDEDKPENKLKRKQGDSEDALGLKKKKTEEIETKTEELLTSKKADDIWSSFLKDVSSSTAKKTGADNSNASSASGSTIRKYDSVIGKTEPDNSKLKKFFSESTIGKDTKNLLAQSAVHEASKPVEALADIKKARPGGLASILGKIDKKAEPSTLLKSKLDWEEFKKKEQLEEDLAIHSKGKQSFLERQAFLNRVDNRQFEIEKSFRTKERTSKDSK